MIIYESNKNWLRDLSSFYKRPDHAAGVARYLFYCGGYGRGVFHPPGRIEVGLQRVGRHSFFRSSGVVLSILLSFRTNSAYDRWWKAAKNGANW